MLEDVNPTTRFFPRDLRTAFPHEHRHAIEHYKRKPNKNKVVWICLSAWIICFCIGKLL